MVYVIILCILLGGCTTTTVIQFNPHKDIKHPVPPPKGWIFEAKDDNCDS